MPGLPKMLFSPLFGSHLQGDILLYSIAIHNTHYQSKWFEGDTSLFENFVPLRVLSENMITTLTRELQFSQVFPL